MPPLTLLGHALLLAAALATAWELHRQSARPWACLALLGATLSLIAALLLDRFELAYVAAYSASSLPPWLKAATLWGGEEGGLLLLATICAGLAQQQRHRLATATAMRWLTLACVLACWRWSAFAAHPGPIPGDGGGLNAHLLNPWMAVHPPLIFIAYALLWLPLGATLAALRGEHSSAEWRAVVGGPLLWGWWTLSAGLASGMWWAFQDFTFGQVWHWDPAQTAALVLWLLATAQLHGLRQQGPRRPIATHLLVASSLTAAAVPLALWVVRDDTLTSSHRYLGDSSAAFMALLSASIAATLLWHWWRRAPRPPARAPRGHAQLLRWAAYSLLLVALCTAAVLLYSYACAARECAREFVPYRSALLNWADSGEYARLLRAFTQWEVDHFRLTPLLAPLAALAILLTGHAFMRPGLRHATAATLAFALLSAAIALQWQPLRSHFGGLGVTTSHTRAAFWLLEILLLWGLWPLLGVLRWCWRAWHRQGLRALRYTLPVALIHLGVVLAISGAVIAASLDSTHQRELELPRDYRRAIAVHPEWSVRLSAPQWSSAADGGIGVAAGVLARTRVERLAAGGESASALGELRYRDVSAHDAQPGLNRFRQRCLVLDHRYGRHLDRPGWMLDPVIDHGVLRDSQLWLPASPPPGDGAPVESVLLLRQFPLLSLLWSGLVLVCSAGLVLLLARR